MLESKKLQDRQRSLVSKKRLARLRLPDSKKLLGKQRLLVNKKLNASESLLRNKSALINNEKQLNKLQLQKLRGDKMSKSAFKLKMPTGFRCKES